jgi:hypothetical protein
MLLVAERLQAFLQGGPRPTEDDMDFMDALERMHERIDDEPPKFERRSINGALHSLRKDLP